MAIRPVPKLDVLECLPRASEIANLRIVNKDLDFIQRMINRSNLQCKLLNQLNTHNWFK